MPHIIKFDSMEGPDDWYIILDGPPKREHHDAAVMAAEMVKADPRWTYPDYIAVFQDALESFGYDILKGTFVKVPMEPGVNRHECAANYLQTIKFTIELINGEMMTFDPNGEHEQTKMVKLETTFLGPSLIIISIDVIALKNKAITIPVDKITRISFTEEQEENFDNDQITGDTGE